MVSINQKNFDLLVNSLNHKMTKIEADIYWLKKIGLYMSSIMTGIFVTVIVATI